MKSENLRMENITIRDKGIKVLDHLFLNLYRGEVLGVYVHNVIEKLHLTELICGESAFERGCIYFNNINLNYRQYALISKEKIALIQPYGKLIDVLTVADNIFVVDDKSWRYIFKKNEFYDKTQILLEMLGLSINSRRHVYKLSAYEKIAVEIAKAYALGAEIIILKDLSNNLSDAELAEIEKIVQKLKSLGISFILFDNLAEIIRQYSDRMLVVKSGSNVWTLYKEEIDDKILSMFFTSNQEVIHSNVTEKSKIALKFENVATENLEKLSFELRTGEILCLVDQAGTYVDEVSKILKGELKLGSGQIFIDGKMLHTNNEWDSLNQGIAFIVENPVETMLFMEMTIAENMSIASIRKVKNIRISERYNDNCLKDYARYFESGFETKRVDELSIFEQQQLVYLKWHLYYPRVVVCIRPFSSIDVELRDVTSDMMKLLLEKGIAVLVLGSNYSEMNNISDKILPTSKEIPQKS